MKRYVRGWVNNIDLDNNNDLVTCIACLECGSVRFTPSSSDFGFDLVNKLQTNRKHIILVTVKIQNPGLCALFLCDYNIRDYVTRRALQVGIGGMLQSSFFSYAADKQTDRRTRKSYPRRPT